MTVKICPICGKEIKVYGKQKRKYCSRACMSTGYKEQLKGKNNPNYRHGPKSCAECGKPITRNAKKHCAQCGRNGADNPFFGKKHSKKTRKKMSDNHPPCSGKNGNFYGRKHKDETKKKISNHHKKLWADDDYRKRGLKNLEKATKMQLEQKGNTLPERLVAKELKKLNIRFARNVLLYDKFFVDFILEDGTILEVFGDYWHANTKIFPNLNSQQIRQKKKDKSRLAYLRACGREVIVLWENNIKANSNLVEMTLNER